MSERNPSFIYDDLYPVFLHYEKESKEELFHASPISPNPFGDLYKRILQFPVFLRKILIETVDPNWDLVTFYWMMRVVDDDCHYKGQILEPLSNETQAIIINKTREQLQMFIDYINKHYTAKS